TPDDARFRKSVPNERDYHQIPDDGVHDESPDEAHDPPSRSREGHDEPRDERPSHREVKEHLRPAHRVEGRRDERRDEAYRYGPRKEIERYHGLTPLRVRDPDELRSEPEDDAHEQERSRGANVHGAAQRFRDQPGLVLKPRVEREPDPPHHFHQFERRV